ncbi:hypothetical protein PTI98_004141 [Pleurotus ostreatus]|nr:hypothetical protein PTI98_004141 [Pleurotus ostreatus]
MASSQGKAFCSICNKEWSRKKTYNEHIRTIHHESYIFSFDSKDYLVVRDGIEHLLCCPLCDVQHENVKNFSHHSRSAHKVVKFSFKAVEGDEEVELEDKFMDVDLPLSDQPVSSPTPKATPLRLPSPGPHLSPAPLVAQPATPPGLGSLRSSSPDLDITPRPLHFQHVTATEPAIGDLTTTATLEKYGLRVHRHYSTVHCMGCLVAWIPSKVVGHLRSHGFTVSRQDEEQLLHVLAMLHVVDKEVPLRPKTLGPPVEGLAVSDGYCCGTCDYACLKESMIERHIGKHKEVPSQYGSNYTKGYVQTFFSPTQRHYFEVTSPPSPPSVDSSLLDIYTHQTTARSHYHHPHSTAYSSA